MSPRSRRVAEPADRKKIVREGRAGTPKPQGEPGDLNHAVLESLSRQTYLTPEEAAIYLRRYSALDAMRPGADAALKRAVRAIYEWARVHGVSKCRMGRSILFLRRDLDAAVNPQQREVVSHRRAS